MECAAVLSALSDAKGARFIDEKGVSFRAVTSPSSRRLVAQCNTETQISSETCIFTVNTIPDAVKAAFFSDHAELSACGAIA